MKFNDVILVLIAFLLIMFMTVILVDSENRKNVRQTSVACIAANGVMEVQNDVFICTKVDANINSNN